MTAGAAILSIALTCGCGGGGGGGGDSPSSTGAANPPLKVSGPEPKVSLPKGRPPKDLVVRDLRPGRGAEARRGDELTTQFVAVYVTGERQESSWERGRKPFSFRLGAKESNPGWERGMPGMRVGGRRELIVPPRLTSRFGVPPGTGPDKTLVYVVELLAVEPPAGSSPAAAAPRRREPHLAAPDRPPPKNLVVRDLIEGTGATAEPGDELTVEYVGIHYDGAPYTNSWKRSKPFRFRLGSGTYFVNPGWEKGIPGMRVGGRRELIVPPKLLQKGGAAPGSRPSDALIYAIDLEAIE